MTFAAIVKDASQTAILEQVLTMETRLMMSLAKPRLHATLLAASRFIALLIALIRLFGGLSYGVTLRTREIGVRTALGATPRHREHGDEARHRDDRVGPGRSASVLQPLPVAISARSSSESSRWISDVRGRGRSAAPGRDRRLRDSSPPRRADRRDHGPSRLAGVHFVHRRSTFAAAPSPALRAGRSWWRRRPVMPVPSTMSRTSSDGY